MKVAFQSDYVINTNFQVPFSNICIHFLKNLCLHFFEILFTVLTVHAVFAIPGDAATLAANENKLTLRRHS